jgi:signal transduction histidine kinase
MKRWRMRTILMVSLLAGSLGLTATCLLIIKSSLSQEINKDLNSDLDHSLITFRNIARERNLTLSREAALLADEPRLKALMTIQDAHTDPEALDEVQDLIRDTDFFALSSPAGKVFTHFNRGPALDDAVVARGLQACMSSDSDEPCMIAFGKNLYELSIQPLYFGPPANGSQLGYVVIGYAIDQQMAREVSEVAAADVAFLVDGDVSATTLPASRFADLRLQSQSLDATSAVSRKIQLDREAYVAAASILPAAGQGKVQLVVLKSYDRASEYLRRVNRWVLALGLAALVIGLISAAAISRTVTRPLEMLVAGARALGQGNFDYRLSAQGAAEVRELALAFDRMRGELKRTQRELLESDRLATIGRMASSVSHDLRHHLSAIYANAEFLSLPQTSNEERLELLFEVRDAVQSMTDLIESLLLFSQTGQTLNLHYESVGLLVERTIHTMRQHPDCRDVQISVTDSSPIEAWIDGKKLGRALYNLLLNACQAAKTGTVTPVVSVTLSEDEEKVRIGIRDSGLGIPSLIRQTLFQPFVSAGKENGIGLGLTLAQHVAQEHGGEVRLEESIPGRTIFSILLYKQALRAFGRSQSEPAAISITQEQVGSAGGTRIEPRYEQL